MFPFFMFKDAMLSIFAEIDCLGELFFNIMFQAFTVVLFLCVCFIVLMSFLFLFLVSFMLNSFASCIDY